jgi:hypothetical protein
MGQLGIYTVLTVWLLAAVTLSLADGSLQNSEQPFILFDVILHFISVHGLVKLASQHFRIRRPPTNRLHFLMAQIWRTLTHAANFGAGPPHCPQLRPFPLYRFSPHVRHGRLARLALLALLSRLGRRASLSLPGHLALLSHHKRPDLRSRRPRNRSLPTMRNLFPVRWRKLESQRQFTDNESNIHWRS